MKNLFDFILDGSRDPMKQMKARKTRLKQPQNGARLNPKLAPKNKRNRIEDKHKRGGHLQR
jgi:hypothetical protein